MTTQGNWILIYLQYEILQVIKNVYFFFNFFLH